TLGDASGYEIKKMFEDGPFAHFHQASFGSIYPALGKLGDAGLVSMREKSQDGRPDKKIYSLTEKGEAALKCKLAKTAADDRIRSETMVMFFLAEYMQPDHLEETFDAYLDGYRMKLDSLREPDDSVFPPHRQFTRGLGRAFYQTFVDYMNKNRHLLLGPDKKGDA
ncbi:MAG: PadR family transcriptional regulator, partial [Alphaproteobacteria bacterium]